MKRLAIISACAGAGAVLAAIATFAIFQWYSSRPRTWNVKAIAAIYDDVDGEKRSDTEFQSLVVRYTLENRTDYDYTLPSREQLQVEARLRRQKSLAGGQEIIVDDLPLLIPAKERVRFAVHLRYPIEKDLGPEPKSADERIRRSRLVGDFMKDAVTNLDGFVIFDSAAKYEIILPAGWR